MTSTCLFEAIIETLKGNNYRAKSFRNSRHLSDILRNYRKCSPRTSPFKMRGLAPRDQKTKGTTKKSCTSILLVFLLHVFLPCTVTFGDKNITYLTLSGVEKVTRSSLKGVLKQGPFSFQKWDFTSNFSTLGHRAFERQICLKNGQLWLLNVPFRKPCLDWNGSVFSTPDFIPDESF